MFILTQDLNHIINTEHVVKFSMGETPAPSIQATLDTGEVVTLGNYLPEDDFSMTLKFTEIFNKLGEKSEKVFIAPYSSDKPHPGEFVDRQEVKA